MVKVGTSCSSTYWGNNERGAVDEMEDMYQRPVVGGHYKYGVVACTGVARKTLTIM